MRGGGGTNVAGAPAARNSLFILAARLIELGASVGVAAIIARHLGVGAYGRYALIVAFVMLFGQFISFGVEHIIIREVARAPGRLRELLGAGMTLELALGALVVPAMVGAAALFGLGPGGIKGVFVFGCAFFLRAFYEVIFRSTFIAFGAARYETAFTVVFQTLRLAFVATAALAGGGVVAILAAVLAAEAVNGVCAWGVLRRKFAAAAPRFTWKVIKYLLVAAWPIAAMGILNNVFFQQDTLVIKWLLGDYRQVGLFAAAYRPVTFFIFVTIPILWPLLPAFSKLAGGGASALVGAVRGSARAVVFIVLPAAVMTAALAPDIIRTLFGPSYLPAASALMVLAFSMAARPLGYLADATLIATGRQWYLAAVAAVVVAVNLVLDIILVPRVGFVGAAWGTLAADVVALVASVAVTSVALRHFIFDRGVIPPVILAAFVGGVLLVLAGFPAWARALGGAAAFAGGTALLLRREEWRVLRGAFGLK